MLGCRNFEFAEVEISSLNSKFPVGMSKFRVCRSRNFEFELEISSWDVEISSLPKSKFRVWTQNFQLGCRNFQFAEVEISSLEVEISSLEVEISSLELEISTLNSKFPLWRSRNFELLVGYIVIPAYWFINHLPKSKFRVWTRNFQLGCRNFQFAEVEISSLNSKFPVGMSKFPVCRSRNFEFELEISSWDVEISSLPKSKFPVWTRNFQLGCRNFQFSEVEISSLEVEISSLELEISTLNSKFPVWRSRNVELLVGYIVVPAYWFINHSLNWKFRVRTGNFDFFKLEIFDIPTGNFEFELEISTSSNWKFRHSNWKFRVRTGNFHFVQLEISSVCLNWKFRHPNWKFRVAFQARMWHQYAFVLISKSAPNQQLEELWTVLRLMKPSLGPEHTTAASLKTMVKLHEFLEHCCTKRNFFLW